MLTTNQLRFEFAPNAQYSYDDIIVYSDELRSTTTFTHNDAYVQTSMVDFIRLVTAHTYDARHRLSTVTVDGPNVYAYVRGNVVFAKYHWSYIEEENIY